MKTMSWCLNAGNIHSTCFWINKINANLTEESTLFKIYLIIDIEKLLGTDNLDEFISNTSF